MILSLLSQPLLLVPLLAAIIIAFTFHEFAHALAAETLGDPTPKHQGRLTLNPLAHMDPMGFLLLVTVGFGWGKPVPFNAYNLKNPKWGSALIGLAGPFSNLILAIFAIITLKVLAMTTALSPDSLLAFFLVLLIQFNIVLMIFNLIPLPPLDGSKLLFALIPDKYSHIRQQIAMYGPMILLGIIVLDYLLPISILGSLFGWFLGLIEGLI